MSACCSSLKPRIDARGARAAMMAPPGTPGAATIMMPSMRMKLMKVRVSWPMPSMRQMASAHEVIFIIDPDMWMVAQRGTVNPAMLSLTPLRMVCLRVTGMVAADDEVPRAVK